MKHQIKLKNFHAETIALIYQDVKSAQKLALELSTEGNLEPIIRADFRIIAEDLKKPLIRIEKRIPKENKEIFNVFFREKPAMMLVELKNAKNDVYASSLAKIVDCTYSHVVKILQEMEKAGLVNFEKQGRLKLLTLTKTGSEIADHIDGIRIKL